MIFRCLENMDNSRIVANVESECDLAADNLSADLNQHYKQHFQQHYASATAAGVQQQAPIYQQSTITFQVNPSPPSLSTFLKSFLVCACLFLFALIDALLTFFLFSKLFSTTRLFLYL